MKKQEPPNLEDHSKLIREKRLAFRNSIRKSQIGNQINSNRIKFELRTTIQSANYLTPPNTQNFTNQQWNGNLLTTRLPNAGLQNIELPKHQLPNTNNLNNLNLFQVHNIQNFSIAPNQNVNYFANFIRQPQENVTQNTNLHTIFVDPLIQQQNQLANNLWIPNVQNTHNQNQSQEQNLCNEPLKIGNWFIDKNQEIIEPNKEEIKLVQQKAKSIDDLTEKVTKAVEKWGIQKDRHEIVAVIQKESPRIEWKEQKMKAENEKNKKENAEKFVNYQPNQNIQLQKIKPPQQIQTNSDYLTINEIQEQKKQDIIGEGSFSKVYKGRMKGNHSFPVAIKEIINFKDNQSIICAETRALKTIKSENVVQIYDFIQDKQNNKCQIVLEFCNEGSLEDSKYKSMPKPKIYVIFRQIINGMNALQTHNIIHRDVKLANILVHDGVIKISDFGFARYLGNQSKAESRFAYGTPMTMAPEIYFAAMNKPIIQSIKCDIWSLGVIFYQLLQDKHPFDQNIDNLRICRRVFRKNEENAECDFFDKVLVYLPEKRMSWEDILMHPLFAESVNQNENKINNNKIVVEIEEDNEEIEEERIINICQQQPKIAEEFEKVNNLQMMNRDEQKIQKPMQQIENSFENVKKPIPAALNMNPIQENKPKKRTMTNLIFTILVVFVCLFFFGRLKFPT